MKLRIEDIKSRDNQALKELLDVVKKSARIGCSKVGAESMEDDVCQDVFMLFLDKLVHKFDKQYNAEPLLIETSRRVALALMRRNREVLTEDYLELSESGTSDINARNSSLHPVDDEPITYMERQRAMEAIKMKFPGVVAKPRGLPTMNAMDLVRKRKSKERELSPSCARLREIRTDLGMTQELFAAQLGIPNATLLSYEYGRTPNVPEKLMDAAEEIHKREQVVARRNRAQAERPMVEILAEWAEQSGIKPTDYEKMADVIGVAKSTVHRWASGEMRPRPRELAGYARIVSNMAKRFKNSQKALEEKEK